MINYYYFSILRRRIQSWPCCDYCSTLVCVMLFLSLMHFLFLMLCQDARNTIGNIPVEWYNDYPHIGYSLDGKRILKPATADEVRTKYNYCNIASFEYRVLSCCLRFEKLIVSSKSAIKILEKFFKRLNTRSSKLKPWTSILDSQYM